MSNLLKNNELISKALNNAISEYKEDLKLFKLYNRIVDCSKEKYPKLKVLVDLLAIEQNKEVFTINKLKEILGKDMTHTAKGKEKTYFKFEKVLTRLAEFYLESLETKAEKTERLNAELVEKTKKEQAKRERAEKREKFEKWENDTENAENTLKELKKERETVANEVIEAKKSFEADRKAFMSEKKQYLADIKKLQKIAVKIKEQKQLTKTETSFLAKVS